MSQVKPVQAPPPAETNDTGAPAKKRRRLVDTITTTELPTKPTTSKTAREVRDQKVIRDYLRKSAHNAPLEHFAYPDLEMRLRGVATKGLVHLFNAVAEAKANRRGSSRGSRSSRGGSSAGGSDRGSVGPYGSASHYSSGAGVGGGAASVSGVSAGAGASSVGQKSGATTAASRASSTATRKEVRFEAHGRCGLWLLLVLDGSLSSHRL